jgi:L,D-transpeptidase YcbB
MACGVALVVRAICTKRLGIKKMRFRTALLALAIGSSLVSSSSWAQENRLQSFSMRLLKAEHRIEKRRAARQAGEEGADLLFGNRAEKRLEHAVRQYETIVRTGGWQSLQISKPLKRGDVDQRLPAIRERLAMTDDLDQTQPPSAQADLFDDSLHDAIVRFQTRHGLPNEGYLGRLTIAAMNVRADIRLGQLRTNLARTRRMSGIDTTGRSVVVNIPAYELLAVNGDAIVFTSRVIVGRMDRQTPTISARILGINVLPTWRVPAGITARDMIPKLRTDPDYFIRENVRVLRVSDNQPIGPASPEWLSADRSTVRFEQPPGPANVLGLIRIDMPNNYTVYLHDTPKRKLFSKVARPFSSGCVRTEKIAELALWLASDQSAWNAISLSRTIESGKPKTIKLTAPVPVYFIYLTSWVEPDGDVNFREDIYRKDNASPGAELYQEHVVPKQPPTP